MDEAGEETEDEKRERIMRRLAEMIQGPPPETGGSGAVASGGMAEAIASLELGLPAEDTERLAGAIESGPDPDEAAALFRAMLESFQDFKRRSGGSSED